MKQRSSFTGLGRGIQPPLPPPNQPSLEDINKVPDLKTSRDIINFLLNVQRKTWNTTILPAVPYPALQKQLKTLLKKYTPRTILLTILQLAEVAKGPFAFSAVKRYLEKEKCDYTPSEELKK